jgi:hypothetical protein
MIESIDQSYKLKVKVVTDGKQPGDVIVDDMLFSVSLDYGQCDAILTHHPNEEFLGYRGIKAWYCSEAKANWIRATAVPWRKYLKRVKPEEFLIHSHDNPRYRVPCPTHWDGPLPSNHVTDRILRAVAVISNHEPVWKRLLKRRFEAIRRSCFVASPSVDLYGSRINWQRYQKSIFSRPQLPSNYCGEVSGDYCTKEKIDWLARYKVCVCLENACEPYYFTEKFVDAVRGGCIPIYRAHPTVDRGILAGAKWVDAAAFKFNAAAAVRFACESNIEAYWEANDAWLNTEAVKATSWLGVHKKIGEILALRLDERRRNQSH